MKIYSTVVIATMLLAGGLHICSQEIPPNKYGLEVVASVALYEQLAANDPVKRLVDLEIVIPGITIDIRYATDDNITGEILYPSARAFLRYPAAEALKRVQAELGKRGLGLKIWDAYRPYSVTEALWEHVRDPQYAADPRTGSRHNRGCAVDVTLVSLSTGEELRMPTAYDDFSERAHAEHYISDEEVRRNREILREIMERNGFTVLTSEWWHFDFSGWEEFELLDIPFDLLDD